MAEIRLKSTGTIKLFENDNTSNVTIASPASLGADRTVTLPDANVTLASGTMLATDGSGASLTALNASELGSGTVPTARLGSGTASSSTVLYGDQTYKAEPVGGGKVLQVVLRTTTTSTVTTDHAAYAATDLYVAITPTLSTSKILYMCNGRISMYEDSGSGVRNRSIVYRDIAAGGYSANFPSTQDITWGMGGFSGAELYSWNWLHMSYLDSPATTSECTYKLYIRKDVASGSGTNTTLGGSGGVMSFIAMEIDNA